MCLYDKHLPLKLACDASAYGAGAVLSHIFPDKTEKPIAYASTTLNPHERNYSELDKEGVAIMFGLRKFRQYIYSRKFTLCTDNKALRYIFDPESALPSLAAARVIRWSVELSAYDYEIEFKTTKENSNADIMLRLPLKEEQKSNYPNAINSMQIDFLPLAATDIKQATATDPALKYVVDFMKSGKWPDRDKITPVLKPYYEKQTELSLEEVYCYGVYES